MFSPHPAALLYSVIFQEGFKVSHVAQQPRQVRCATHTSGNASFLLPLFSGDFYFKQMPESSVFYLSLLTTSNLSNGWQACLYRICHDQERIDKDSNENWVSVSQGVREYRNRFIKLCSRCFLLLLLFSLCSIFSPFLHECAVKLLVMFPSLFVFACAFFFKLQHIKFSGKETKPSGHISIIDYLKY